MSPESLQWFAAWFTIFTNGAMCCFSTTAFFKMIHDWVKPPKVKIKPTKEFARQLDEIEHHNKHHHDQEGDCGGQPKLKIHIDHNIGASLAGNTATAHDHEL